MKGRTLSHYEVLEKIGEGGMGVVYRARDTSLERIVALKILPPDKISDSERKRRFIQEAKAASALNHPNIVTIYSIECQDGVDFISMEHVAGKTLDEMIPARGMRLNQALRISEQIAGALARAHAAGIVHRDLKPSNVMVREDGLVKILDFGLAKLTETAPASVDAPTQTLRPPTEEGRVVGTVAYMSPEQAQGMKVDGRSDIFSFGALLYEMVTGHAAFRGDSKMSTLAAVINKEPEPLSAQVPHDLAKVIQRCLRKNQERRFQHMDDVRVALEELKEESESGELEENESRSRSPRKILLGAAGLLIVAGLAGVAWLIPAMRERPVPAKSVVPLTTSAGNESCPSFSPDGQQVAFAWNGEKQDNWDIYVKLVDSPTPLRLTTAPEDDFSPAWSPDGRSVAFLRKRPAGVAWILIPAIGGPERVLYEGHGPSDQTQGWLAWFPDGKALATSYRASQFAPMALGRLQLDTGEIRALTSRQPGSGEDISPAVSPNGRTIAFSRGVAYLVNDIYLLPLDAGGAPAGAVRRLTNLNRWAVNPVWAPRGDEILFASGDSSQSSLWRIPTSGSAPPARIDLTGNDAWWAALSPKGDRLAFVRMSTDVNIWRLPLAGEGRSSAAAAPFLASTRSDRNAQYSPDGTRIVFQSDRSGTYGIWVANADGSGATELVSFPNAHTGTPSWSPDGHRIAFDSNAAGQWDVYVIAASGGRAVRLTPDPTDEYVPSWSRDGRWIYFASPRSGMQQVYRRPATGGAETPVTREGGHTAIESSDGRVLYYTKNANDANTSLWKVPTGGGPEAAVLPSIFARNFMPQERGIYFIPAADGKGKFHLQYLEFASGAVRTVASLSGRANYALTISPDHRFLLYAQFDHSSRDLMLVDQFR